MKNIIKHRVSDQRNLSFVELSIGKWKRHQNQSFSENTIFYVSKLKRSF